MSKILEAARDILASVEVAADNIDVLEAPSVEEQYIAYLYAELTRANKLLDVNKTRIFADALNLTTKGRIEKAAAVYDKQYFLTLGLSLASTAELADELISLAKDNGVQIPKVWNDISGLNIELSNPKVSLLNRKKPVI